MLTKRDAPVNTLLARRDYLLNKCEWNKQREKPTHFEEREIAAINAVLGELFELRMVSGDDQIAEGEKIPLSEPVVIKKLTAKEFRELFTEKRTLVEKHEICRYTRDTNTELVLFWAQYNDGQCLLIRQDRYKESRQDWINGPEVSILESELPILLETIQSIIDGRRDFAEGETKDLKDC